MFLTVEKINQIIARLEESDKAISGAVARDQLMWGQTTMFFNLLGRKDAMSAGLKAYGELSSKFKVDMMALISDYQKGSLNYAGAIAQFKSLTGSFYQAAFKAGAIAMGNPYYEDPAIGLTKRDLSFIQKARNFESKFLRKFLLDIKNPDFKPKYDFQTRAGFYADSGKTQFFNGMVNGAGDNVEIHWIMSEAVEEHCEDCPVLASKVYTWKTLPTTPRAGDTACLFNCKCELEIVPKQASAPTGQSFNPYTPGSATPKAMEVPGRWAQVTRGGETMVGQLSKDIEDLYQQMYKARQMITVTKGAEKMDWVHLRRDINAEIIRKAGASKVRVTPTVSVTQLAKVMDSAMTKAVSGPLPMEALKTGQEVILVRGNFWTPGVVELRGTAAYVKTAKGVDWKVSNLTDIIIPVNATIPQPPKVAPQTPVTAGWKPKMAPPIAAAWSSSGAYAGVDFYHFTRGQAPSLIMQNGFNTSDGIYGQGIYLTRDFEGVNISRLLSTRPIRLTVRVNVTKPYKIKGMSDLYKLVPDGSEPVDYLKSLGYDALEIADRSYLLIFDKRNVVVTEVKVIGAI